MTIKTKVKDHWRAMDNEYIYATIDYIHASIILAVLQKDETLLSYIPAQRKLLDKVSTILMERAFNA